MVQLNSINPSNRFQAHTRERILRAAKHLFTDRGFASASLRMIKQYRDVVIRFKQAPVRALPQIPEQDLVWRMHFMFGAIVTRRAALANRLRILITGTPNAQRTFLTAAN